MSWLVFSAVLASASAPVDSGAANGWLAQADAPQAVQLTPQERISALRGEYNVLDSTRPGIALPVVLWSVGSHVALGGLVVLLTSRSPLSGSNSNVLPGVALLVSGLGATALGFVVWGIRRPERNAMGDRMDAIEREIEQTQRELRFVPGGPVTPVTPKRERLPEDVPAPMQVKRDGVFVAFTVARF